MPCTRRLHPQSCAAYHTLMTRRIFSIIAAGMLAACGDSHDEAQRRDSHRSGSVKSGAQDFGQKTGHAFRKVGGHLEKFFTGHDTITK